MKLEHKKVAILATDGFELSELIVPKNKLEVNGAEVHVISDKKGKIRGWEDGNWSTEITVDNILGNVKAEDYHALVLPGGVMNPDSLRVNRDAMYFIRDFFKQGKPVGAICHAPWLLISANVIENREVTSYKSIQQDLENAGAQWFNQEVVVDNGLVTSRNPDDLPAFCEKLVEEIAEGIHEGQKLRYGFGGVRNEIITTTFL